MVTAIVLAAGESRRMGPVNKLLLPWGEDTLVQHVVATVSASAADETIVVLGHEADQVEKALANAPARIVRNHRYQEGMATSIHAGVKAARPQAEGYMICLCDLPAILAQELDRLIEAFRLALQQGRSAQPIVVPCFQGRRGNPVIFASSYRQRILENQGALGCKGIVRSYPDRVVEVEMPTDSILRDIDTPGEYEGRR